MVFQNNVLSGAAGSTTPVYSIDQSIRFPWASITSGGYMNKTYSGAGDRTSWTWSCWFKLGGLNNFTPASNYYYALFSCDSSTSDAGRGTLLIIADSGVESAIKIQFQGHSTIFLKTTKQFRDPSAWYHITLVWDSDNGVASDRARLYINGQRETSFTTQNNPTSGQEIGINLAAEHRIGGTKNLSSSALNYPWDGYMAEIHFLDGYSYGPEYFGETNDSGILIPKEYSGSYGSNGFKIDGRDSSDLGDDESGNGNDYTTSGFASHDQVADTPTNNFAVMNPLDNYYFGSTFTEGNLLVTTPNSAVYTFNTSSILVSSGKWYAEFEVHHYDSNTIGVAGQASGGTTHVLGTKNDQVGYYAPDGSYYKNNSQTSYGNSYGAGDIVGVALDLDNSKLYFSKNGTWQNSGNPASGASGTGAISIPAPSATVDGGYRFACGEFSNNYAAHNINFGQDGTFNGNVTAGGNSDGNGIGNFKYSVPSGYLALCTSNLGS